MSPGRRDRWWGKTWHRQNPTTLKPRCGFTWLTQRNYNRRRMTHQLNIWLKKSNAEHINSVSEYLLWTHEIKLLIPTTGRRLLLFSLLPTLSPKMIWITVFVVPPWFPTSPLTSAVAGLSSYVCLGSGVNWCSWKSTMNWMQAIVHAWEWAEQAQPQTQ